MGMFFRNRIPAETYWKSADWELIVSTGLLATAVASVLAIVSMDTPEQKVPLSVHLVRALCFFGSAIPLNTFAILALYYESFFRPGLPEINRRSAGVASCSMILGWCCTGGGLCLVLFSMGAIPAILFTALAVICTIFLVVFVRKSRKPFPQNPIASEQNFQMIQKGMSRQEVRAWMGTPLETTDVTDTWKRMNTTFCVTFEAGFDAKARLAVSKESIVAVPAQG